MPPDSDSAVPADRAAPVASDPLLGNNPADLLACALRSRRGERHRTGRDPEWEPPDPERVAELLPRFAVEALIGRGAMGAVYRGRQASLERAVAIKLLPAELSEDGVFTARFRREARTLAALSHPAIVSIHDFGETAEGHLYIVMEHVEGTTLDRLIAAAPLDPARAVALAMGICEALNYAHAQGIVHRDIKPSNILIDAAGMPKLADFGLARPVEDRQEPCLTLPDQVVGTPEYMAPEQRYGMGDHRADIYAVGVILYEMLTGTRPSGVFDPPSAVVPVDVGMDEVVHKALRSEPARRYQGAAEMKADIARLPAYPEGGAGEGGAAGADPIPVAGRRGVWAAVGVTAVLAGGIWFSAREPAMPEGGQVPTVTDPRVEEVAREQAERQRAADMAHFKEVLTGYEWKYVDEGWPESMLRFFPDGTFHERWKWQYWVTGRRTLEVQYNRKPYDPAKIVSFEFNEELTEFRSVYTGDDLKVHRVAGYRRKRINPP